MNVEDRKALLFLLARHAAKQRGGLVDDAIKRMAESIWDEYTFEEVEHAVVAHERVSEWPITESAIHANIRGVLPCDSVLGLMGAERRSILGEIVHWCCGVPMNQLNWIERRDRVTINRESIKSVVYDWQEGAPHPRLVNRLVMLGCYAPESTLGAGVHGVRKLYQAKMRSVFRKAAAKIHDKPAPEKIHDEPVAIPDSIKRILMGNNFGKVVPTDDAAQQQDKSDGEKD